MPEWLLIHISRELWAHRSSTYGSLPRATENWLSRLPRREIKERANGRKRERKKKRKTGCGRGKNGRRKKLSARSQYAYAKKRGVAAGEARTRKHLPRLASFVHSAPKRPETAGARKKILSARRNSVDQSSLAIIISRGDVIAREKKRERERDENKLRRSPHFFLA